MIEGDLVAALMLGSPRTTPRVDGLGGVAVKDDLLSVRPALINFATFSRPPS
jgi:hypothetical protein